MALTRLITRVKRLEQARVVVPYVGVVWPGPSPEYVEEVVHLLMEHGFMSYDEVIEAIEAQARVHPAYHEGDDHGRH